MAQSVASPRRSATSKRGAARSARYESSPTHERARLRVVPKSYRPKSARRRHARRVLAATSVSVCAVFFGVLALQVMLMQNQFKLQKLQRKISVEKTQFVKLRSQVGQLESPTRVIADAKGRLGMIEPSTVNYLRPVRPIGTVAAESDDQPLNEWIALKQMQATFQ